MEVIYKGPDIPSDVIQRKAGVRMKGNISCFLAWNETLTDVPLKDGKLANEEDARMILPLVLQVKK
jgi:hypothetical protein